MEFNLYEFYQNAKEKEILFYYSGPIAQSIIEGIAQTLRKNLKYEEEDKLITQYVFSIFIEQMQNVLNYSAEKIECNENDDSELSFGSICIGYEQKKGYYIYCGNQILNSDIEKLSRDIEDLRYLNKEELKELYKKRRRMDTMPGSKGAGLGLIEMARKASKPLEYSFTKIDLYKSFFTIKVVVGGSINE